MGLRTGRRVRPGCSRRHRTPRCAAARARTWCAATRSGRLRKTRTSSKGTAEQVSNRAEQAGSTQWRTHRIAHTTQHHRSAVARASQFNRQQRQGRTQHGEGLGLHERELRNVVAVLAQVVLRYGGKNSKKEAKVMRQPGTVVGSKSDRGRASAGSRREEEMECTQGSFSSVAYRSSVCVGTAETNTGRTTQ